MKRVLAALAAILIFSLQRPPNCLKERVADIHRLVLVPWKEKLEQDAETEKVVTVDETNNYAADVFRVESLKRRP